MSTITLDELEAIVKAADAPHVDLGPVLGAPGAIRVGLTDLHELMHSGEPAFKLEAGPTTITVRRQDGGMLATLEVVW